MMSLLENLHSDVVGVVAYGGLRSCTNALVECGANDGLPSQTNGREFSEGRGIAQGCLGSIASA